MTKRNIKLILEFDGTDFKGWQIQNDVRTVQAELTGAVRKGLEKSIAKVIGCSRTDAGVHAKGCVVTFSTSVLHDTGTIKKILNSHLPDDVSVLEVSEELPDFDARYSALSKVYCYRISNTPDRHPLKRRDCWHVRHELDIGLMQDAAKVFEGTHDFTAFSGKLEPDKDPVRTIHSITVSPEEAPDIIICILGKSFLYKMVRIIAATLVEVGLGRLSIEDVGNILVSKERDRMCAPAPAKGLTLMKVNYEQNTNHQ